VSRDDNISFERYYGLKVHKSVTLSERCSTTIRWQIRLEPKVRDKLSVPNATLLCNLRRYILTRTYQAAGYYLGNQHVSVVQALARYMYLQALSYEVSALPSVKHTF
jgi:hypothetical protein